MVLLMREPPDLNLKKAKGMTLEDELPRSGGDQYATEGKNRGQQLQKSEAELRHKAETCSVVGVSCGENEVQ